MIGWNLVLCRSDATVRVMVQKRRKPVLPTEVRQYFQEQGRQGGKVGGKLRWKDIPPEERTAHAKKAVAAREAKKHARVGPKKKPPTKRP